MKRSVPGRKLWPEYLGAWILLPFAAAFLFFLFDVAAEGQWPIVLFLAILCLWFLAVGILGVLRGLMTAHFVPEGIAFTLGNRTIRQIPARQLGMFFCIRSAEHRSTHWILGVSTYSPETLVQLQLDRQFRKRRAEVPVFFGLEGRMQMLRQLYPQVPVADMRLSSLFSRLF